MASIKAQTKAVGDAVKRNQFDEAIEQIHVLFQKDPQNYLGYELSHSIPSFLGLTNSITQPYLSGLFIRKEEPAGRC